MTRGAARLAWLAIAAGFLAAAAVHALALARPEAGDGSPPWRHAVFVVVNLLVAAGVVVRPRGFAAAFAALTAQQLWSHGRAAVDAWRDAGRVDWASVVVLLAMPAVLVALVRATSRATR